MATAPTETGGLSGLTIERATISVGGRVLVRDLSVRVPPGQTVTIMGESGAGKSSLLAWVCGMLPPGFSATGRTLVDGRDVTGLAPEKRGLGVLFQDEMLFPHMSVGENLAFALPPSAGGFLARWRARSERRERVERALATAGLPGSHDRDPEELSGGQRARVALMRTLLSEPKCLLLDEPFSSLDADTRESFRGFVFGRARELGLPTLMVTHDVLDAQAADGEIVRLSPVD